MSQLLTDPGIKAALRKIKTGHKTSITLADAAPRGAGRLLLVVKPDRAEWYARHFVDGRKRMIKLGTYPELPLGEARAMFGGAEKPQDRPGTGSAASTKGVTIGTMFEAYLESMEKTARPKSVKQARGILERASGILGPDRAPNTVTPADIVSIIRPIYDRGAPVQADKYRMYLNAAFQWAMSSTYSYKVRETRDWGLTSNPVAAVPRDSDAEGVGNRWLSKGEYIDLMNHLMSDPIRNRTPVRKAVLLVMLTGMRANEILSLRPEQWDSRERLLSWEKTKNDLPHVLPVCPRAAAVLDSLAAGSGGWFFPNESGPEKHMPDGSALMTLKRYCLKHGVAGFTTRDLRRTWKTLAGEAGLTKEDRDLLQNHKEGDASSVHYDRYEYLREKRAAVAKWSAWLDAQVEKARH